ncbi:hypothetical protein ACEUAX_07185 [Aeromonas veronii]
MEVVMFSLLLCASLWQFDTTVLADKPPKEFAITHQEPSQTVRERVADQLGHAWQDKKSGTKFSLSEPGSRYSGDSPLTRMANDRDNGGVPTLAFGK